MPSTGGGGGGVATSLPTGAAASTFSERCSAVVIVIHGFGSFSVHGSCSPPFCGGDCRDGVPAAFCASSARSLCSKHAILRNRSWLVISVGAGFGCAFLSTDCADALGVNPVTAAMAQLIAPAKTDLHALHTCTLTVATQLSTRRPGMTTPSASLSGAEPAAPPGISCPRRGIIKS